MSGERKKEFNLTGELDHVCLPQPFIPHITRETLQKHWLTKIIYSQYPDGEWGEE